MAGEVSTITGNDINKVSRDKSLRIFCPAVRCNGYIFYSNSYYETWCGGEGELPAATHINPYLGRNV